MLQPADPAWRSALAPPPFGDALEVHVWRACVSELPADTTWLSRWGKRSTHAPKRVLRAKMTARCLVDSVLQKYIGGTADELEFSREKNGRPYIAGAKLDFNLSHSGDWALLAVSAGTRVGVDIEQVREDRDFRAIACRYFSASEAKMICDSDNEFLARARFYALWTAKEAALKAVGTGIAGGLAETSLEDGQHIRLPDGATMRYLALTVDLGYPGALAVDSMHDLQVRFYHLRHR